MSLESKIDALTNAVITLNKTCVMLINVAETGATAARQTEVEAAIDEIFEPASEAVSPAQKLPWAEKTKAAFDELSVINEPILDHARKALMAIDANVGREHALAALKLHGAEGLVARNGKTGLAPEKLPLFFATCLNILSGELDLTKNG